MLNMPFRLSPVSKTLSALLLSGSLLAGCASLSEHPDLVRARTAFQQAQSNPDVAAHAPVALHEAEQALKTAEAAQNEVDLRQLAYVAQRKIEIAVATAERNLAEKKVEKLGQEKGEVVLSAREQEVDRAKQEAEAARRQAEEALSRARELEKELADLQGKQTERGLVLTLGDVLFETGKAELLAGGVGNISKVAEFLLQNPKRNVLIEGHTDSVGGDSYNMRLSEQRANAVLLALIQRGVPQQRIIARGYGKTQPVADNGTETGRQQNRRVEIVILNEGDTVNFR